MITFLNLFQRLKILHLELAKLTLSQLLFSIYSTNNHKTNVSSGAAYLEQMYAKISFIHFNALMASVSYWSIHLNI